MSEDIDFSDVVPVDSTVTFRSTWQSSLPSRSNVGIMTAPEKKGFASVQTTERDDMSVQTGMDQASKPKAKTTGLQTFLERVTGAVLTEMKKVEEEHEVLEPLNRLVDEQQEPAICSFELNAFPDPATSSYSNAAPTASTSSNQLVVTSLSWSATGQTIAASYGRYDIPGWCEDRGALATWNLARESLNQNKPDMNIDVDNCLMCCTFHPEHPALIAGGTFNGDVYIWDLSVEGDSQRGKTDALSDVRHREPIKSMVWQYSMNEFNKYGNKSQAYRLITLGADGLVMVWTWHKLQQALYGFKLLWPQPGSSQKVLHGGSCLSFQAGGQQQVLLEGSSTFMVGTEGGKIFKCYMELNDGALKDFAKAASSGERQELRSPIKDGDYKPHAGAVFGVHCSPFQKDLFLTAGYDGSVHLYHSLKQQHLMDVAPSEGPLHAVQWSPVRPLVFAAAAGDGQVYFYDLLRVKGLVAPVLAVDASPEGLPVYACAFNTKKPDMFATGGADGIQVWKLPESLSGVRKGEEAVLRRLAAADDFEEALRKLKH
ncbi:hypothetical protein CEUSTIGMA_g5725.t1 [Chlamydomonas eustigma]|uniref:Uncharacterized protein n=1 Tax=Chlamydomonas eustigma TaxID=1157962 RepID=A0A250X5E1_9CHLO|nr:hypothetical protein CEUSTIGMA_g5725.t1 [Chlamydomonas eustigma]|eukprot:GAX78283.1 hypothetical protein CEUSTIGMA_g5725.t1 [Chlamydomonas eustigma]